MDTLPIVTFGLRLLVILSSVALALSIAGGVEAGNATTINDLNNGIQLRHIGVILFLVLYILIIFTHGFFWSQKEAIMKYRRKVSLWFSCCFLELGNSQFRRSNLNIATVGYFSCPSISWRTCAVYSALWFRTSYASRDCPGDWGSQPVQQPDGILGHLLVHVCSCRARLGIDLHGLWHHYPSF